MTNADKIRLIAEKLGWMHQKADTFGFHEWIGDTTKGPFLMAVIYSDRGWLTPAGASAVLEKLPEEGIEWSMVHSPSMMISVGSDMPIGLDFFRYGADQKPHPIASVSGDNKEDATRDAAAQYWRDNAHRLWSEDEKETTG